MWALAIGGYPPLDGPYAAMLDVTRAAHSLSVAAAANPPDETVEPPEVTPGDWDSVQVRTSEAQTGQFVTLYEALATFDDRAALGDLNNPARLASAGDRDTIEYGPSWGDTVVRLFGEPLAANKATLEAAGWTVRVLPGLDHMSAMRSDVVLPLIRDWLEAASPAREHPRMDLGDATQPRTRTMLVPLLTIAAVAVALAYVQALQGLLATLAFSALAAILSRAFQRRLLGRGLGRGLSLTLTVVAFILILVLLGAAAVAAVLAIAVQLSGDTESLREQLAAASDAFAAATGLPTGSVPSVRRRRDHRRGPPAAVDGRPGGHEPVHVGPDRHLPAARRGQPARPDDPSHAPGVGGALRRPGERARRVHQGAGDARLGRRGPRHDRAGRARCPSALLWGVLSFLFSFVPNIGFILALIPPTRVAVNGARPRARSWSSSRMP